MGSDSARVAVYSAFGVSPSFDLRPSGFEFSLGPADLSASLSLPAVRF